MRLVSTFLSLCQTHTLMFLSLFSKSVSLSVSLSVWPSVYLLSVCRFLSWHVFWPFFNYPPSSGIASCVGTMGMVMCHLHLMGPCCVALGRVLIWGLNPDCLGSFVNWVFSFPEGPASSKGETRGCCNIGSIMGPYKYAHLKRDLNHRSENTMIY